MRTKQPPVKLVSNNVNSYLHKSEFYSLHKVKKNKKNGMTLTWKQLHDAIHDRRQHWVAKKIGFANTKSLHFYFSRAKFNFLSRGGFNLNQIYAFICETLTFAGFIAKSNEALEGIFGLHYNETLDFNFDPNLLPLFIIHNVIYAAQNCNDAISRELGFSEKSQLLLKLAKSGICVAELIYTSPKELFAKKAEKYFQPLSDNDDFKRYNLSFNEIKVLLNEIDIDELIARLGFNNITNANKTMCLLKSAFVSNSIALDWSIKNIKDYSLVELGIPPIIANEKLCHLIDYATQIRRDSKRNKDIPFPNYLQNFVKNFPFPKNLYSFFVPKNQPQKQAVEPLFKGEYRHELLLNFR